MNIRNSFAIAFLIVITLLAGGCTYVQPVPMAQQQYEYNPGYNPNNVVAEAIIASAIINGVTGYRYGGAFYPQAYYGGMPGYYVGGVFHTSQSNRTTIVNNYNTGRSEFQRNPAQYAQKNPGAVTKPNFGSQAGGMTKGPATSTTSTSNNKPNFGSQQGGMTKQAAAPSRPNFGSQVGSGTRTSSAPSPSYSAPPSRSYSSSSSSSSTGRSSRR